MINTQQARSGDATPSYTDAINTVVKRNLLEVNTAMPGRILSYDSSRQRAVVQPVFDIVYADGSQDRLAPISNVPVQFPRSTDSFISFPVDEGTPCLLIFSQRALDAWIASGNCVDPRIGRIFDITDAFAIPGISSDNDVLEIENPDNITIKNKDSEINLTPDGKVSIGNSNEELLQIILDFILGIRDGMTATSMGPQPFINPTDPGFVLLEQRLKTLLVTT